MWCFPPLHILLLFFGCYANFFIVLVIAFIIKLCLLKEINILIAIYEISKFCEIRWNIFFLKLRLYPISLCLCSLLQRIGNKNLFNRVEPSVFKEKEIDVRNYLITHSLPPFMAIPGFNKVIQSLLAFNKFLFNQISNKTNSHNPLAKMVSCWYVLWQPFVNPLLQLVIAVNIKL